VTGVINTTSRGEIQTWVLSHRSVRYSPNASSNVNYVLFCGWCEMWFIWNKNNTANATHAPKNVPRPNWSNVGPEMSRTGTWTCTNTISR